MKHCRLFEPLITFESYSNLVCFSHNADMYPTGTLSCPLVSNSTSIRKLSNANSHLLIYPNPSNSSLTVKYEGGTDFIEEITIYNYLGMAVNELKTIYSDQILINLPTLPKGTYFFKVLTTKKNLVVSKIVIY
ncbi:MAG: T9SS type A sorting domain-containing protein [Bacteroidetes bacterium]|nr:T9SS type A sorting domain-containing protein [Bacteroidota bacterium]